jgi:hypothetical protein
MLFVLVLLTLFYASFILNKRQDSRHTHTQQRKTHACNEARIDESSSFAQRHFVLFRSLFLLLFLRTFFFYSKINFPSSSTDGPVAVTSLSSHIFFCDSKLPERLCWRVMEKEKNNNEENFLHTTNNCCFFL